MGQQRNRRTAFDLRTICLTAAIWFTFSLAQPAAAHWPSPSLVSVDVYDRTDGTSLVAYAKDGHRYVVGTPGHEYALRIRNNTAERILAVTSVDGVNVVSGETASPDQSGYVIDAYGSVEIGGWRKSLEQVAAFYFTDLGDSYAARTGRPGNVGVIGVAVFKEKRAPIAREESPPAVANGQSAPAQSSERSDTARDALASKLGT